MGETACLSAMVHELCQVMGPCWAPAQTVLRGWWLSEHWERTRASEAGPGLLAEWAGRPGSTTHPSARPAFCSVSGLPLPHSPLFSFQN